MLVFEKHECTNGFCNCDKNCNPLDYYCFNPSKGDEALIGYYQSNTLLPGPLNRPKPKRSNINQPSKPQGPPGVRGLFHGTQLLDYADPSYAELRGAAILPGHDTQQFNIHVLPDGYFQEHKIRAEKCGCGKKLESKRFN